MELYHELTTFIAEARRNCWAADRKEEEPLHPGSTRHVYVAKNGDLRYEDEYFGGRQFHGMEVVYSSGRAMWVMSYQGFVPWFPTMFTDLTPDDIYKFLREALLEKSFEARLSVGQKPIRYEKGWRVYEDIPDAPEHSGTMMSGRENILIGRFLVAYQGTYMGCLLLE